MCARASQGVHAWGFGSQRRSSAPVPPLAVTPGSGDPEGGALSRSRNGRGPGAAGKPRRGVRLRFRPREVVKGRRRCHPQKRSPRATGHRGQHRPASADKVPFGSLRTPSPDEGTAPWFSPFGVLRSVPSRPLSWGPRHSRAVTAPHPGLRLCHRRVKPV